MQNWWQPLVTLLSGGLLWEGFKFFYPDIKQRFVSYYTARKAFYTSLDPILKAADELYGKINSLAQEDFATYINQAHTYSKDITHNRKYVIYLFGQFWAQLEYIRVQSQYTSLTQFKKGRELLKFIDSIESRKFRILDRSWQRVVGETLIEQATTSFRIMNLHQFIKGYDVVDSDVYAWAKKLEKKLYETSDDKVKQRILVFGIIVAALIDHFDPKHAIVHVRQGYINKLSETSKKIVKRDLLGRNLNFIKNKENYYIKKGDRRTYMPLGHGHVSHVTIQSNI